MAQNDIRYINLGLPQAPDYSDKEPSYRDVNALFNAVRNLALGVGQQTGLEKPYEGYRNTANAAYTVGQAKRRLYVVASVAITYGQVVNTFDSAGTLQARLADATNNTKPCHGICNTPGTCSIGDTIEIVLPEAHIASIGGLTRGTTYYLSTTPGSIQNTAPSSTGNLRQSIGFAISPTELYFWSDRDGGTVPAPPPSGTVTTFNFTDGDFFDGTVTNPGTTPTLALKIVSSNPEILFGRGQGGGAGDMEEITLGSGLALTGTVLSTTGSGTGDVVGPASAVNNNVVFFDGITGKLIKDSGLALSGSNTGDQLITLTSDVTGSGTGSFATTIANDVVTFAKMQNIATDRLIGRDTAGSGDPEELTVGGNLEFTGSGGIQRSALTGDVVALAGSGATSISNLAVTTAKINDKAVTFAKFQDIATDKLVGRDTAGSGSVEEIAVANGLEFDGAQGIRRSALTGDVTAAAGSNATTIANLAVTTGKINDKAVTYAKIQDVSATNRLLGRDTAGAGVIEELTVGGGIEFTGSGGIQRSAFSGGDVTGAAGSATLTIAANAVTNAKFRQSAALSVVGNATNAAADVADIAAGSDHNVLRRSGTSLGFGAINLASSNAVTGILPDANIPTTLTGRTWSSASTFNALLIVSANSNSFNQTVPTASSQSATPIVTINGGGGSALVLCRATNDAGGPRNHMVKTRSTTADGRTAVTSGDNLGTWFFEGTDGTNPVPASRVESIVDAAVSAGIVPGRLDFYTYNTSGAATLALRINSAQDVAPQRLLDISAAAAGQIKFPATANLSANANTFDEYVESSYTGTATGLTTSPTQTIRYVKAGAKVTIAMASALTGTSNATTFTITGMPAGIRPATAVKLHCVRVVNNGAAVNYGHVEIGTGGVITIFRDATEAAWTNAGTKTVHPFTFSYPVT